MPDFRVSFGCALTSVVLAAACGGGRYRSELVGHGNGAVSARSAGSGPSDLVAAPGAGGIQLPPGNYELAMRFDLPRAQVIDWKIACPGVDVEGTVGETFAQYRAHRLEQLSAERERERERVAAATSLVVGAMTPRVQGETRVRSRGANVRVHAEVGVDADAVGDAVARTAVGPGLELPPGDVGRGSLAATAHVMTAGDGVCALQVTADDPDVRAVFQVTRLRDLEAEQRMRTIATREVAVKARGQLTTQLLTQGADVRVHQARLEREAAVRAQADLARGQIRARAEARTRVHAQVRARTEAAAIYARGEYLFYLSGTCGAEPGLRARIEEREARAREARLVAYADLEQRREQTALRARAELRGQLVAAGAKERPPMPATIAETPGAAPFDGATWRDGYWSWAGAAWEWTSGGWTDPDVFDDAGGDDGLVGVGVGVGVGLGVAGPRTYQTGTRDHRRERDHVRDHRDLDEPRVRDHRSSRDEPKVRDHRETSGPRDRWTPKSDDHNAKVRDHRDDSKDKDKDDDKPRVRDHR